MKLPTEYMLTTIDNPFDPFANFKAWYAYDLAAGYHTPSFLARIATVSDDTSEAEQIDSMNDAIDEIVRENVLGIYRKVSKDS